MPLAVEGAPLMTPRTSALCLAFAIAMPSTGVTQSSSTSQAVRVVHLAAGDDMRFSPATIDAKPGERLRVSLHVTSAMPKLAMSHNFVLLRNATDVNALFNESFE